MDTEFKTTNAEVRMPRKRASSITIIQAVEKAKTEFDSSEEFLSTSSNNNTTKPKKEKSKREKMVVISP